MRLPRFAFGSARNDTKGTAQHDMVKGRECSVVLPQKDDIKFVATRRVESSTGVATLLISLT